jgi:hypothetical protein
MAKLLGSAQAIKGLGHEFPGAYSQPKPVRAQNPQAVALSLDVDYGSRQAFY